MVPVFPDSASLMTVNLDIFLNYLDMAAREDGKSSVCEPPRSPSLVSSKIEEGPLVEQRPVAAAPLVERTSLHVKLWDRFIGSLGQSEPRDTHIERPTERRDSVRARSYLRRRAALGSQASFSSANRL